MTWEFAGSSSEDEAFSIDEIDVWSHGWKRLGEVADVADPQGDEHFSFPVYEITEGGKVVRFAAGEFANGAWGFFCEAGPLS